MATYKMLKTQRGVRKGEVHSVVFHEGKTYEIDDDLAGQFKTLEAIKASNEDPIEPLIEDDSVNLHENWLDTDPAVLRHGELTAAQVIAKDESDNPQTTNPAEQEVGKAEGDEPAAKVQELEPSAKAEASEDGTKGKPKKGK